MTALALGIMAASCHKEQAAPDADFDYTADRFA